MGHLRVKCGYMLSDLRIISNCQHLKINVLLKNPRVHQNKQYFGVNFLSQIYHRSENLLLGENCFYFVTKHLVTFFFL